MRSLSDPEFLRDLALIAGSRGGFSTPPLSPREIGLSSNERLAGWLLPGDWDLAREFSRLETQVLQTAVEPALVRDFGAWRSSPELVNPVPWMTSAVPSLSGRASWIPGRVPGVAPAIPGAWRSEVMTRFGWWAGGFTGSPTKVGEYQGLAPSPFFDIDTINSNGRGTIDLWASGLNSDAYDLHSYFYRDGYKAWVDYQQFPHRLIHELLSGGTAESTNQVVTEDLNVGQDYAVRVRQVDAGFRGPLTEHLSWKVNVFVFQKFGDRQANASAHCFNMNLVGGPGDNRCHVLSQSQRIDWLTTQVEPGLEAKFNNVTIDYARTMRSFEQNDEIVYRTYNRFGAFGGNGNELTIYPYALVPNALFEMDRLKLGVDFTRTLRLYSYLYNGNMHNDSRGTDRAFRGFDTRLIKTTDSGVTATAYAKYNVARNELPPFLLPEEQDDPSQIRHPINYDRFWGGLDGQWFPFRTSSSTWRGLSFRANYEYHEIAREFANFPLLIPDTYERPPTLVNETVSGPFFSQPNTRSNSFTLDQRMRWNSGVITFARYQMRFTENPLYGVQTNSGVLNSNLPTQDYSFELGGSWAPRQNLLLSARAEFQTLLLDSSYADFVEQNYPVLATIWYAPTEKLSISGGYSYFSNWVNQDITLGYRGLEEPPPAETLRFGFDGQTHIVNVGARYAWSRRLILSGGVFWVDGANTFSVPPSRTGADWSQLPLYSNVRAELLRFQAGFDYNFSRRTGLYFRVNTFDYQDRAQNLTTGTSYFFLGGLSALF